MPQTPSSDRATTRKPETAPPRIATWTASTRLRRAAEAVRTFDLTLMYMPMIPDAIEQAAPTRKAIAVTDADRRAGQRRDVGDVGGLDERDDDADDHGADDREQRDRRVLAADEGDGALEDGAGDVLHLLGPRVTGEHVAGQVDGEQDGDDARRQDDQLERTGVHQGCRILLEIGSRDPAMARMTSRFGTATRERLPRSNGHPPGTGTLQNERECIKAPEAGSNSERRFDMHARRPGGGTKVEPLYCAVL